MRLTQVAREALLVLNDGYQTSTSYKAKNFSESRTYTITEGHLQIRSHGKGAFGGSQFDNVYVADDKATHRFLYDNLDDLSTDGIEEVMATLAADKASRRAAEAAAETAAEAAAGSAVETAAARTPTPVGVGGSRANDKTLAWVSAGVLAIGAAAAAAPHVGRLWREHVTPRAQRFRAKRTGNQVVGPPLASEPPSSTDTSPNTGTDAGAGDG